MRKCHIAAEQGPRQIDMPNKKLPLFAVLLVLLLSFAYFRHRSNAHDPDASRADLLSLLPGDASAAGFVDLQQLRNSPFLTQIMSWASRPVPDGDYAQFVQATGFDYERDLDRVALSLNRQSPTALAFAVAEGRFDRRKIEAYASQSGSLKTADGKTLFAVPISGSARKAYFIFLRDDRVAWANDSSFFFQRPPAASAQEWREHFSRVAGTPLFAVLRQDPLTASALAQAPGGFRSPQLATLLSQLQWITISAKPEGNLLRVVIDGEGATEATAHQLKDLLSGLVVLAQAGLNDAKTSKQLDPELRLDYSKVLQSADIQLLDRGTRKSVRVIFEVTPKLLEAPHPAPATADSNAAEPHPPKSSRKNERAKLK
jgi:hypothetical protein